MRHLFLVVIGMCLWGSVSAEGLHVQGRVVYMNNPDLDSVCLVSFPFTVNRDDFEFLPDTAGNGRYTRVFAELTVRDTSARIVKTLNTYFGVHANSAGESVAKGIKIFHRIVAVLKPGIYSAKLSVIDVVSKREGILTFDTVSVPAPARGLKIGGAILAYRIAYVGDSVDQQSSRLVDNGYLVVPNPLGVFSMTDSTLFVYAEIYGLMHEESRPTEHRLAYAILDPTGQATRNFGSQLRPTTGSSLVIAQDFPFGDLGRGGFIFRIIVEDLANGAADTTTLPLWHIESEADLNPPMTAYDSLTLPERLAVVRYLLTPVELSTLNALTVEGKTNFLAQYWKEHDTQRGAVNFMSQTQLVERFKFVNRMFSTTSEGHDGWKTDRGRIYLTYGPWEERTVESHPLEGQPYDIWHYRSIKSGYFFVFVDLNGLNEYRMVHSNAPGERFDQSWDEYFKTQLFQAR